MSAERLAEIRARAAAATPGPWEHREVAEDGFQTVMAGQAMVCDEGCFNLAQERANLAFIAAARSDVPWLCDRVDELEAAIEVISGNDYLWRTGQIDAETAMAGNRECLAARAVLSGEPEA